MIFGSVFSGIGGIDLGLERAGMRCAWQIERNPHCRRVLRKHWPGIPCHQDVRAGASLRVVDLIAGGPPCQPFSSASHGRKNGVLDNRFLWPAMRRIVEALRPRMVLCENVTQFDGAGLETVVADLEACGYEVAPPFEIPACAFGFDHWRPRLWIFGYTDRYRQPGGSEHDEVAVLPFGGGDQPGELGEADGVSGKMDRLSMLGNAVVPDVAEWIGRRINDCDFS